MYHLKERNNRLTILLRQKERIFHTQDLAVLWGITNLNTLYTTIKRYTRKKILHRIFKGLYSTVPPKQLDPLLLGIKALHGFVYVSCETVLQEHGLINPFISDITLVSQFSKKFTVNSHTFRSRKLQDDYLYNPCGIQEQNGIKKASKERAIADMLYFNSQFHFDAPVNWKKVEEVQKMIGYPLTPKRYVAPSA